MEDVISEFIQSIEEKLLVLTPMEVICRDMYRMEHHLEECSFSERQKRLTKFFEYIPQSSIPGKYEPDILTEKMFFKESNIVVVKHCRYLPARLHTHTFFELFYIAKGECIHTCRAHDYHLIEGDFCLWEFNSPHEINSYSDDFIGINILIRQDIFESVFFELLSEQSILSNYFKNILYGNTNHPMIIFRTKEDIAVKYYMYLIYNEYCEKKAYHQIMLSNYLNTVLVLLLRDHILNVITAQTPAQEQHLLEILDYIQANYHSITFKNLCEYFNYSPSYLSRLIKKSFGIPFSKIVQQKRLEKACWLLKETDINLTEIAAEINCSDASHFCHIFTKEYHISPTKYRELHSANS